MKKMTFIPELTLYIICWTTASIISLVSLIVSCRLLQHNIHINEQLEQGWLLPNIRKDASDLEWEDFKRALFYDLRWWFFGHILLSLFIQRFLRSNILIMRNIFFICYGLVYSCNILGIFCTLIMVLEVSSMFIIAKTFKTTTIMWSISFIWIIIVQCFLNSQLSLTDDYHRSLQLSSLAYTVLRSIYFSKYIISFEDAIVKPGHACMQKYDSECFTNEKKATLVDCLAYCFYMPLLTFGQLTVFEKFKYQICYGIPGVKMSHLLKKGIKIIIWTLFYEIISYFCYPYALLYEGTLLWNMSLWSLAGTAYVITQLFTVKYVVLWSYTSLVARLDGVDTPALPECTSHCHQSSIIWRTFDNGLYEFIKRSIYIPMGGSQSGLKNQLIASLCSFLFLCLWHGLNPPIMLWCLTSYLSVVLDILVSYAFSRFHAKLNNHMSENGIIRIRCVFTTFNLAIFLFGTLIFLGDVNLCCAMFYRIFIEGFPTSLLIYLFCTFSGLQAGRAWKEFKR